MTMFTTHIISRAALLCACALPALAGQTANAATAVYYSNNGGSFRHDANGFATVTHQSAHRFGNANGYEFLGGVGVSAFAATGGNGYQNVQVTARASFSDVFRVTSGTPDLFDAGSGVFILNYAIKASGDATANGTRDVPSGYPNFHSSAIGSYDYNYTVGGQSGFGGVDVRSLENGTRTTDLFGNGAAGTFGAQLFVRLGELVNVSLSAGANASADGSVPANGTADFGHTLRWGGVSSVQFRRDGSNQVVDLPDGFKLNLPSQSAGFDYINAAGPNPYTGAVPEPANWALTIVGFGAVGGALRRGRAVIAHA